MKRTISAVVAILLLVSMLTLAYNSQRAKCLEPPATEWSRAYGGANTDYAWSVIQTSDGGYAIVGWTDSFGAGEEDFWLIKTDVNGNMQWNQTYGDTVWERAYCVIQTSDGGYAIAGETRPSASTYSNRDFWLVKTYANGTMQWNQTYGGANQEEAYSVIQTSDGGYALAGRTLSFGPEDFWLVKTDASGNMQWNKAYGGSGPQIAYSVVQTSDGGYTIGGENGPSSNLRDFWLVKTDASGNMQWNKKYGVGTVDASYSMVQTTDGGYALVGQTETPAGSEFADFYLVKTDASGNMQWNKTYGGTNGDQAWSVVQTSDGGYALLGHTYSFGIGSGDFWLVKTDAAGNHEWNQTYGGAGTDLGYSVIQTVDGGYALAGFTESYGAGGRDFWLIKLAPEPIPAMVDIDPDTLNLKSRGGWITAYIELPEGHDVADINVSTIMLNDTIPAEMHPVGIGDEDGDGTPDLMVKFDSVEVTSYVLANVNMTKLYEERFMTITLTITGKLYDETQFQGSDTIRIMMHMPRGLTKLLSHPIPF